MISSFGKRIDEPRVDGGHRGDAAHVGGQRVVDQRGRPVSRRDHAGSGPRAAAARAGETRREPEWSRRWWQSVIIVLSRSYPAGWCCSPVAERDGAV